MGNLQSHSAESDEKRRRSRRRASQASALANTKAAILAAFSYAPFEGHRPRRVFRRSLAMVAAVAVVSVPVVAVTAVPANAASASVLEVNSPPTLLELRPPELMVNGVPWGPYKIKLGGYPAPTITQLPAVPQGMTITADGVISGTPNDTNLSVASTLIATNSSGSESFFVQFPIYKKPTAPKVWTATVGQPSASVGMGSTGWTFPTLTIESGQMPDGLSIVNIASGPRVVGTPSAGTGGVYNLVGRVANNVESYTQPLVVTINEAARARDAVHGGLVGSEYAPVKIAGGYPVPTTTIVGGALPAGLTLSSSGVVSGTPAPGTAGTYSAVARATNPGGTVDIPLAFEIAELPGLTGTLPDGKVGVFYPATAVTMTGSPAPVASISAGKLPAGLTLSSTGVVTGRPAAGSAGKYDFVVTATSSAGKTDMPVSLRIVDEPTLTGTAHDGTVGEAYAPVTLTAAGYPSPTLAISSGALPAGLVLSAGGVISGRPAAGSAGIHDFTVTATSAGGRSELALKIVITEAPSIADNEHAVGVVGTDYTPFALETTGFPKPTVAVKTGKLPEGLTLSSAGVIAGRPAAGSAGTYELVFTATNSAGAAEVAVSLTIAERPAIAGTVHDGIEGSSYSPVTLTVSGSPAPTLAVTSGQLPAGVTLSPAGVLSGRPGQGSAGKYQVVITATNSVGSAQLPITIVIASAPTIAGVLHDGIVGTAYAPVALTVSGSPAPTVAISKGALPAGLTVSSSGVVSGRPAAGAAGTYTVTMKATNSVGSAEVTLTFAIADAPTIAGSVHNGMVGTAFVPVTLPMTGTPAPTASVVAGALPAGLALSTDGTISGTPQAGSAGKYAVTFAATSPVGVSTHDVVFWILEPAVVVDRGAGDSAETTAVVVGSGFTPGGKVEVWIHSAPRLLDTVTADADGRLRLAAGTLPAGEHHFELTDLVSGAIARSAMFTVVVAAAPVATPAPTSSPAPAAATEKTVLPRELAFTGGDGMLQLGLLLIALMLLIGGLDIRRRWGRRQTKSDPTEATE